MFDTSVLLKENKTKQNHRSYEKIGISQFEINFFVCPQENSSTNFLVDTEELIYTNTVDILHTAQTDYRQGT